MGKPHTKKSPAQRNIEYTARLEKKKEKKWSPCRSTQKEWKLKFRQAEWSYINKCYVNARKQENVGVSPLKHGYQPI